MIHSAITKVHVLRQEQECLLKSLPKDHPAFKNVFSLFQSNLVSLPLLITSNFFCVHRDKTFASIPKSLIHLQEH